ncbi:inner membrane CreD family protein [Silvibacterium sp.]|uniref:inner membrane CreD family protein n=1 Tax=Silvibacterium sp. TaxID=1964179 RepID=UPI0039E6D753
MQSITPQEMRDWNPRSMGMKLLLLSVLALFMTIPSFFVSSLVEDRSQIAAHEVTTVQTAVTNAPASALPIRTVDSYRSVTRSLKYVLLFLGLVFLTYFVFEATTGTRVHPAQYVLVGTAQLIFYLLLLSLTEKVGFDWAFLMAGGATVGLLSTNAGWIFESRSQGWRALAVFGPLYTLIYLLLRLEDDALLIGAIMSFLAVAVAMYFTRKIDWYSARTAKEKLKTNAGPEFFQGLV